MSERTTRDSPNNSSFREKTPVNSKFKVPKLNRNKKGIKSYHNLESDNENSSDHDNEQTQKSKNSDQNQNSSSTPNSNQKIPAIPPRKISNETRQSKNSKTSQISNFNPENSPLSQFSVPSLPSIKQQLPKNLSSRRDSIPESNISNSNFSNFSELESDVQQQQQHQQQQQPHESPKPENSQKDKKFHQKVVSLAKEKTQISKNINISKSFQQGTKNIGQKSADFRKNVTEIGKNVTRTITEIPKNVNELVPTPTLQLKNNFVKKKEKENLRRREREFLDQGERLVQESSEEEEEQGDIKISEIEPETNKSNSIKSDQKTTDKSTKPSQAPAKPIRKSKSSVKSSQSEANQPEIPSQKSNNTNNTDQIVSVANTTIKLKGILKRPKELQASQRSIKLTTLNRVLSSVSQSSNFSRNKNNNNNPNRINQEGQISTPTLCEEDREKSNSSWSFASASTANSLHSGKWWTHPKIKSNKKIIICSLIGLLIGIILFFLGLGLILNQKTPIFEKLKNFANGDLPINTKNAEVDPDLPDNDESLLKELEVIPPNNLLPDQPEEPGSITFYVIITVVGCLFVFPSAYYLFAVYSTVRGKVAYRFFFFFND